MADTRKLIVEVVGDTRSLERSFKRSQTAIGRFDNQATKSLGRFDSAFSRTQRIAAGGFIGGAAVTAAIAGIRSVVTAAAESQQVLGQTRIALESTGKSWERYGAEIEKAVTAQSRLGFDDEALLRTFSLFVRNAGSVGEALRRNNIAMDVARARFIDLEQAAALVNKAALGQAGALRRVGIDARNGATGVELLTMLERQFGGAAAAASDDATTSMERFSVAIENLRESVGNLLLPVITDMADELTGAAESVQVLVDGLRSLEDVKITPLKIPLFFEFPGAEGLLNRTVGKVPKEFLANLLPPQIREGGKFAKAIVDALKDQTVPNTQAAAAAFEGNVDSFLERLAKDTAKSGKKAARGAKAFGEAGFKPVANELGKKMQRQFDSLMDALSLKLDQATLTKSTADDLAALGEIERAVNQQIRIHGRTTELLRLLFNVDQERAALTEGDTDKAVKTQKKRRADLEKIARERQETQRRAAELLQASQFRAIGLSETGGAITPGVDNLRKQFAQLSKNVVGQDVPRKLLDRLALVGKALSGGVKNMKEPTRAAIKDLFDTIRGTFDTELTKGIAEPRHVQVSDQIARALGFDQALDTKALQRLQAPAPFSRTRGTGTVAAGGMTITGNVTVVADNPDVFLRELQKKAGRATATSRGRFPGQSLGLG
jgi:hypothetical protein